MSRAAGWWKLGATSITLVGCFTGVFGADYTPLYCTADADCGGGDRRCLRAKAGATCVTPEQAACPDGACADGTTCVGGTCLTVCRGTAAMPCLNGQACVGATCVAIGGMGGATGGSAGASSGGAGEAGGQPVGGSAGVGGGHAYAPCSGGGGCDAGQICYAGYCAPQCQGPSDCDATTGHDCFVQPTAQVCGLPCDPVAPANACASGASCAVSMKGTSTCVPASTGADGMDCSGSPYVCKPGYACFSNPAGNPTRTCRKWCRYPNDGDCSGVGSATCLGFNPPVVVDGTAYGSCF